jgi:hypothetical protein
MVPDGGICIDNPLRSVPGATSCAMTSLYRSFAQVCHIGFVTFVAQIEATQLKVKFAQVTSVRYCCRHCGQIKGNSRSYLPTRTKFCPITTPQRLESFCNGLPPSLQHHASIVFVPEFLDGIKRYSTLRFMDWGQTNNSPLKA